MFIISIFVLQQSVSELFIEVRNASINSVCELATRSECLALLCQDHLVDMFNDELEAVRLNAINALRRLGQHVVLREDQCEILLGCLKVPYTAFCYAFDPHVCFFAQIIHLYEVVLFQ